MKVLVTGSTGFIGSHLCRALIEKGYQVRAFHRPTSPLTLIENLPVEHAIGDITQPLTLADAVKGIDIVFSVAAKLGKSTPDQTYDVTVKGTRNVLQACMQAGVRRVVHTSSVAALGVPLIPGFQPNNGSEYLMDENHSWNYRPEWWYYGYAKHLAEMEVQHAIAHGLDAVIVNPTLVVGAGDINRISGDVILHVARGHIKYATSGGLNAIHISDTVQGHIAAFERGQTGERYILGSQNMTHRQFLEIIASIVRAKPPQKVLPGSLLRYFSGPVKVVERIVTLPFSGEAMQKAGYYFYYDVSKAETDLGLINKLPIEQAIRESYQWYQENGYI